MPLIIPSNSISGEFEVANSLRFDDGSSDYLNRTPASASNRKTFTFSTWVKRCTISSTQEILYVNNSSNDRSFIEFNSTNEFKMQNKTSGSINAELVTDAVFRDVSAWYHIVVAVDTTQATASDRIKLYVNGVQETSFSTETYPSQNTDFFVNNNQEHSIGRRVDNNSSFIDAYLSEIVLIDGSALDSTSFGEFDADTGIWKPIDVSGLTFGTNGFYLDFENSGALGQDDSGNGNNFTVNNLTSIDQTTDTPTNNFATMNPLNNYYSSVTFSEGNNKTVLSSSVNGAWNTGTIGISSGKWYWEVKTSGTSNGEECQIGIADKSPNGNSSSSTAGTSFGYNSNGEYGVYAFNGAFIGNAVSNPYTTWGSTNCGNSIVMIAVDLDNNKFYGGVNGTWFASGDPANGTNGKSIQAVANTVDGFYYPAISSYQGYTGTAEFNFGNPPFTISSGNSDGNGYGNFEYSVPSGYYALNTKNLAEYG